MSKPLKPAAAPAKEAAAEAPPKSKKKMIMIISVLLLGIAGSAGWYFTKGQTPEDGHTGKVEAVLAPEAKFIPLGENFTVNLQREEGDQYLQAGITLKILQPELEEQIKKTMPEIRSKLLFLLSSKRPSELQTSDGKKKLIAEIIAETDSVLGFAPSSVVTTSAVTAVPAHDAGHEAPVTAETASSVAAASAPVAAPAAVTPKTTGVVDVLFTSFIIQ